MSDIDKKSRDTQVLERLFVPGGKIIIKEGEAGDDAFLIQSGRVFVYTETEGSRVDLAEMGAGQIIGEMALVSDSCRTASVEAVDDCNLIVITRQSLNEKLAKSDPTIRAIVPMLMKRIKNTSNALSNKLSDMDDLESNINMLFETLQTSMSAVEKQAFQNTVGEKLDEFLKSLHKFRASHDDL